MIKMVQNIYANISINAGIFKRKLACIGATINGGANFNISKYYIRDMFLKKPWAAADFYNRLPCANKALDAAKYFLFIIISQLCLALPTLYMYFHPVNMSHAQFFSVVL